MNFVLAVVVFFAIGLFTGYADTKHTVIGEVTYVENSNNTLEKGDEITSMEVTILVKFMLQQKMAKTSI